MFGFYLGVKYFLCLVIKSDMSRRIDIEPNSNLARSLVINAHGDVKLGDGKVISSSELELAVIAILKARKNNDELARYLERKPNVAVEDIRQITTEKLVRNP